MSTYEDLRLFFFSLALEHVPGATAPEGEEIFHQSPHCRATAWGWG